MNVIDSFLNLEDDTLEYDFDNDFDLDFDDINQNYLIHNQSVHLIDTTKLDHVYDNYTIDSFPSYSDNMTKFNHTQRTHTCLYYLPQQRIINSSQNSDDIDTYLDFQDCLTSKDTYQFQEFASKDIHQVFEERPYDQLILHLSNKLSRYCGYFINDSKEMEYFDKIRLQEINYRFSKTYFY